MSRLRSPVPPAGDSGQSPPLSRGHHVHSDVQRGGLHVSSGSSVTYRAGAQFKEQIELLLRATPRYMLRHRSEQNRISDLLHSHSHRPRHQGASAWTHVKVTQSLRHREESGCAQAALLSGRTDALISAHTHPRRLLTAPGRNPRALLGAPGSFQFSEETKRERCQSQSCVKYVDSGVQSGTAEEVLRGWPAAGAVFPAGVTDEPPRTCRWHFGKIEVPAVFCLFVLNLDVNTALWVMVSCIYVFTFERCILKYLWVTW